MIQFVNYPEKHILITNHRLCSFAGSELVTLDLVSEFRRRGWFVSVGCFELGEPIKGLFDSHNVCWVDLNLDEVSTEHYDLMWGHHFSTFHRCLLDYNLKPEKVIFSSLSPYESLECPPLFLNDVTLCVANSLETGRQLSSHGVDPEKLMLFENCVPASYFQRVAIANSTLRRVAIVSNHVPAEILAASELLRQIASVDIYGVGHNCVQVTADLLHKYDLVVTIGRTVQQCMALRVPVFCYDRFGGPGYITSGNFDRAAEFNFSGRCTGEKLKDFEIFERIVSQFDPAVVELPVLYQKTLERYSLERAVDVVLDFVENCPTKFSVGQFIASIYKRQKKFFSHPIFMQLFIDDGGGFREDLSIKEQAKLGDNLFRYKFDDYHQVSRLRFDPLNVSCVLELRHVILIKDDKYIDCVVDFKNNADFKQGNLWFFYSADSQFEFDFTSSLSSYSGCVVEISFSINNIDSEARERILSIRLDNVKNSQLSEHSLALNGLRDSLLEAVQREVELRRLYQEMLERQVSHDAELALFRQAAQEVSERLFHSLAEREQAFSALIVQLNKETDDQKAVLQRTAREDLDALMQRNLLQEELFRNEIAQLESELRRVQQEAVEQQQAQEAKLTQAQLLARREIEAQLHMLAEREQVFSAQILLLQRESDAQRAEFQQIAAQNLATLERQRIEREEQLRAEFKQKYDELHLVYQETQLAQRAREDELASIFKTLSWRWTSPFRRVGRWLGISA